MVKKSFFYNLCFPINRWYLTIIFLFVTVYDAKRKIL